MKETTLYSKKLRYLAKRLRDARVSAGLDQHAAARKFGKTQSFISKIESGQRRIRVLHLIRFMEIYGRPAGYFINDLVSAPYKIAPAGAFSRDGSESS
ncbi:MAG: helix-turn-helix transcriptional regulator [Candidatus Omnitrophota bacterium]|nr:helix-turn-helix transcriptional regulator [Candidatus Omnitrophota bacterium]MBU2528949.1 helix-turn-helix transcriptional regulator [bacterium]MBU3930159.1 helix-turn-helix transcriptional regulator [bacterium]MBU4122978.1 helix-turn-helix transcriptional regulator [bacterium]